MTERMDASEFRKLGGSHGGGFHRCVCAVRHNTDQDQSMTCEYVTRGKVCGEKITFANWRTKGRRTT